MNIKDLVGHKESFISELAKKAERIKAEFNAGELTQDEYAELVHEITRVEAYDKVATTEELRRDLLVALEFLSKFLKFI